MGADHSLEVLDSTEVVPEKNLKPKKRKAHSEVNNLLAGNKQEDDQPAIDKYDEIPTFLKMLFDLSFS